MDTNKYLEAILASQNLGEESAELKRLREERDRVRSILFSAYSDAPPSIRYAGSYAKGTLIKEAYDLDMTSYFARDNTIAGETLEEIWESVKATLSKDYLVQPKTSALRLMSKSHVYFHIDVVPGRFVDDDKADVNLHQNNNDSKERLKTNLDVHVSHIKNSGLVPAIRLLKLWKTRRALGFKQFVFELLIIDLLHDRKNDALDRQLLAFWESVANEPDPIIPEDPANPHGNDLSPLVTEAVWWELRNAAISTLSQITNSGWETVFGTVPEDNGSRSARLQQAAAVITHPTKPWHP